MMVHSPAVVKGALRPDHASTRQIPFSFRADPVALDELRLPRTARQVFVLLLDNARGRGWKSRLSNGVMGRVLSCTTMTIKRALAALESAGLIRREMIAGGRIRLCIHLTWQGVEPECSTAQVATGTSPFYARNIGVPPLEHPGSTNQSAPQSERTDGGGSPGFRTTESPDPATAAAYLRQCVAAGMRGDPMPEPPGGSVEFNGTPAAGGWCTAPPLSPKGIMIHDTPAATPVRNPDTLPPNGVLNQYTLPTAPVASPGAFLPSVGRMVASLGERLKAEGCGPRRVGPAKLARQLGEMRRKHGRRE